MLVVPDRGLLTKHSPSQSQQKVHPQVKRIIPPRSPQYAFRSTTSTATQSAPLQVSLSLTSAQLVNSPRRLRTPPYLLTPHHPPQHPYIRHLQIPIFTTIDQPLHPREGHESRRGGRLLRTRCRVVLIRRGSENGVAEDKSDEDRGGEEL